MHYFLMAFAFLIAAIHWFDYFAGHLPMSPLYNSFVVLTTIQSSAGLVTRLTKQISKFHP